jgi:hypothetical protein
LGMLGLRLVPKLYLGMPLSPKLCFEKRTTFARLTRESRGSATARRRPFPSATWERGDLVSVSEKSESCGRPDAQ